MKAACSRLLEVERLHRSSVQRMAADYSMLKVALQEAEHQADSDALHMLRLGVQHHALYVRELARHLADTFRGAYAAIRQDLAGIPSCFALQVRRITEMLDQKEQMVTEMEVQITGEVLQLQAE